MKQSLKVTLQAAALALVASSTTAQAYRIPFYSELNHKSQLDGNKHFLEIYTNWTFKINENLAITPEMKHELYYKEAGTESHLDHNWLRILVNQKNVATFGAWNLDIDYRWTTPTRQDYQLQGSFGALGVRPKISMTTGNFKWVFRNMVQVFLVKDNDQVNVNNVGAAPVSAGNPLFANGFEFLPEYQITASWKFAIEMALNTTYIMAPAGGTHSWKNEFTHEYILSYTDPVYTKNTSVGVSFDTTTNLTPGKEHTLFTKGNTNFNIKLAREF